MVVAREQVLRYRAAAQQLRDAPRRLADVAVLDLGVQDTGTDGAAWALANRGVAGAELAGLTRSGTDNGERDDRAASVHPDLMLTWTLRGAPHVYRRSDTAGVAAATAPYSEADAAKRIFDAAKPLREAGIGVLEALDVVAAQMRDIVSRPTVKGELSAALTARLDGPYVRYCRPCDAVHCYEQPFRLSALRAGLELQPGTSPPVLQRIKGWHGPAAKPPRRLDPVRAYLRLLGPATPKQVAGYLDAPVAEVKQHWPDDAVEVDVDTGDGVRRRSILAGDRELLDDPGDLGGAVRLLAPYDLFLQARDRELLVPDPARRKTMWVVLGRPGAVTLDGDVVGVWRPRASGRKLRLAVELWRDVPEEALVEQAERLAAHRGVTLAGFIG